jgi:hypothetical protein
MTERELLNSVELRPAHAGRRAEFPTMITHEMAEDDHGTVGDQDTFHGRLVTVENGRTVGRARTRVALAPDNGMPPVISVLGSHRWVELVPEPGHRP